MPVLDFDEVAWIPGGAAAGTITLAAGLPHVIVGDVWDSLLWACAPLWADSLAITAIYDSVLSKVTLTGTGLEPFTLVRVERSTDLLFWKPVRGGLSLPVVGGTVMLDDYEFVAGIANFYRLVTLAPFGQPSEPVTVTPVLDSVWLKSVTRPFLNRAVTVTDWSDVQRPARSSDFDAVGRSLPVAVTDVRGSKRFTLDVYAATSDDAQTLDFILASGDVLFVHTPAGCEIPGGYMRVDASNERRPHARASSRVFTMPCTEVAPPGPDVVGSTNTWTAVLNSYPSWSALLAANSSWSELLARIAPPSSVVVL